MMQQPTSRVDRAAQLGVEERLSFKVDMTAELLDEENEPVATITSVTWYYWPEEKSLTLNNPWISEDRTLCGIYAEAPEPATYYRVEAHVTLSTTEKHVKVWGIGGIRKSAEGGTPITFAAP